MCKILNIPMEVKRYESEAAYAMVRSQHDRWLNEYAKKHMSKHIRVYCSYQLEKGSKVFMRAFLTHRNAVTTEVKRTLKKKRLRWKREGKKY